MNWNAVIDSMIPTLAMFALRTVGAMAGLWLAFRVASLVQDRLTRVLRARSFDATLSVFFGNLSRWAILVASVLAVLSVFGIETTSFAAIIGAAGLAIGLAFQGTLSNFSAGVMLLTFRPFKVGDLVVAGGIHGFVIEIGLFSTAVDTKDGRRFILPNAQVANAIIENQTINPLRRAEIVVVVGSTANEATVRKALEEVGARAYLRDPGKGHDVQIRRMTVDGSEWAVRVWAPSVQYDHVMERTTADVMRTFAAAGIPTPTPFLVLSDVTAGAAPGGPAKPA
jgi:small conductance mechanosensitive channel